MQRKHQLKSSYTNYSQPIKSASHHQRWAKLANQQASDAARDQSKKVGSLSQSNTHHTEKGRRGGRENNREKTEIWRDAGGGASPHERTQKNTYMMWRRERESEQSIQMCNSSNEQTETTRCSTQVQKYIWPFAYIGSNCTWATMEKWWTEQEWVQKEYSLDKRQRMGGCKYHSSKTKQNKQTNKKIEIKPQLWNTARHSRSVSHTRKTSKHTTTNTHHPEPNWSKSKTRTLYRNQNEKLQWINQWLSLHCLDLKIIWWQLFFFSQILHITYPMVNVLSSSICLHPLRGTYYSATYISLIWMLILNGHTSTTV